MFFQLVIYVIMINNYHSFLNKLELFSCVIHIINHEDKRNDIFQWFSKTTAP